MIIAKDKSIRQYLFPRTSTSSAQTYTIEFYSCLTKKHYVFEDWDEADYADYYTFNLDFETYEDMKENADYEYAIKDGKGNVLDTGMLRIGHIEHKEEYKYTNNNEEYIEYQG